MYVCMYVYVPLAKDQFLPANDETNCILFSISCCKVGWLLKTYLSTILAL